MFPKNFEPKDLLFLNKMVTPGFMTILYWLLCVVVVLGCLGYMFMSRSFGGVIGGLFGIVIGLLYVRVLCEVMIVLFNINSNLQKIADKE